MSAVAHDILFKESNGKGEAPKICRDTIAQRARSVNGTLECCRSGDLALDSFQAFLSEQQAIVRKEALFINQGDYWKISYQGSQAILKATRGLRCLSCLLRHPGREFHVRELIAFLAETPFASRLAETDAILDSKAKAEYKLRLDDLRGDLQEAERFGDDYRAARARAEIDLLAQQLAATVGLGGRDRRAPSDSERARSAVTKRIKEAINRIGKAIPLLGRHLATRIRTGYYCSYSPDPDSVTAWTF
jgi:non-specific serine/threonine protein kinase